MERRCIFCRQSGPKSEFWRFVLSNQAGSLEPLWDKQHNLPGRGAYCHRRLSCWAKMRELGRWEHAFRVKGLRFDVAGLQNRLKPELLEESISNFGK